MKRDTWPTAAPQAYLPCGAAARLDLWPTMMRVLWRLVRRLVDRIDRWQRHRRTLRALSKLDHRMLKDIGLSGGLGSIESAANENRRRRAA